MRLPILVFVSAVLGLSASSLAQQPPAPAKPNAATVERARYVGLKYVSLPDGLEEASGELMGSVDDPLGYALREIHRGRVKMLWLERKVSGDKPGQPNWEVKDVLVLPAMLKRQNISSNCYAGKKSDQEIVAIVAKSSGELLRVRRAWRANRKTEKFEGLSLKGITCVNEGIGGP